MHDVATEQTEIAVAEDCPFRVVAVERLQGQEFIGATADGLCAFIDMESTPKPTIVIVGEPDDPRIATLVGRLGGVTVASLEALGHTRVALLHSGEHIVVAGEPGMLDRGLAVARDEVYPRLDLGIARPGRLGRAMALTLRDAPVFDEVAPLDFEDRHAPRYFPNDGHWRPSRRKTRR